MIDVKRLREQPDLVRSAIANKKFNCDIDAVLELDKHRREKITEAEKARAEQKAANQEMAGLAKGSPEFLEKVKEMKLIGARAKELELAAREADEKMAPGLEDRVDRKREPRLARSLFGDSVLVGTSDLGWTPACAGGPVSWCCRLFF